MADVRPAELLDALQGCGRVLITGPVEPDGDSIGACLALRLLLRRRGVSAEVAGAPGYRYAWMPGADTMLPDEAITPDYDAVVVMDGDRHRLMPNAGAAFAAARVKGIVDHHASTRPDGYTHSWIEPQATSTCEMVYDAFLADGDALDAELAALLYVGCVFDTGGFRYSNTTPATHRMAARLLATGIDHTTICARVLMERREVGLRAAGRVYEAAELLAERELLLGIVSHALFDELGLVSGDLEGIIDTMVHVIGVEVAALLIERPDSTTKVSLRSRGRVNVAEVAKSLSESGGGHAKAAGASMAAPVAEARNRVAEVIGAALEAAAR